MGVQTPGVDDGKKGKDGKGKQKKKEGGPLGSFLKMRRRLTVTGSSETIDGGIARLSVDDTTKLEYNAQVRCAVSQYTGVSKKGHAPYNPRKKNQDAMIMSDDPATNSIILCVLDGHGEHGDPVAQHFQSHLVNEMLKHPSWVTDCKVAARDAIIKVEHQVIRNFRIDTEFSGTTLTMVIIRSNKIFGINIGDSRAVIGKEIDGVLQAEEFTVDHKPDLPKEKERIIAAGGRVFAVEYDDGIDGPPRVWLGHMDVPGLAMSRSLGDAVAHTAGVISEPEFTERDLNPDTDKFVIVATDGLWEFCSSEETVEMADANIGPGEAVDFLVREANNRWMAEEQVIDDTTVIIAYLFYYESSGARK